MKNLLVTSINPLSNLPFQIECFNRWKAIGFEVRTINVREEAERLRAAGIESEDIKVIEAQDSGIELFGKPVPRIKPLLKSLLNETAYDSYIISNSDIFPAIRSSSIARFWGRCNIALALTREECHALEAHAFSDESPYRGGLDAFFITKSGLPRVTQHLSKLEAADRMAFGIPGWDYLMGACMLSPAIGGTILDSRTLLHVSHRPSYGNMEEFTNYVSDMSRLGVISRQGASEAVDEFATRIEAECERSRRLSRMAKLIYYSPSLCDNTANSDNNEWRRILLHLVQQAPQFECQYRTVALRSLVSRFSSDSDGHLAMALSFMLNSQSVLFRFTQALFAIAFSLHCKTSSSYLDVTESYPKGNQHAAALSDILNRYSEADPHRRLEIAKLFGTELVDYGLFNRRLYNYLALCCENDTERALLAEIYALTRREQDAA